MSEPMRVVVIGGGPAGLTAAYEITKRPQLNAVPLVLEASDSFGGIARTEVYKGYRFDIGGHRFFTKLDRVERIWHDIMGPDFITVQRLSRIYYRGRFFDYPLKIFNALSNMGPYESVRVMLSYLKRRLFPFRPEDSFETWVINRFGGRLYMHFFKGYTEKVWGIEATEITADWAAQRIKNLSLSKAVWNAVTGANETTSLIEEFQYPRLGPGMMWDRTAELVEQAGGDVRCGQRVTKIIRQENKIIAVETRCSKDASTEMVPADHVINSMALDDLIGAFNPPPPANVISAAKKLRYRDFLIVTLILKVPDPFPDNWIYVHSPDVKVGRIQNFRAWSAALLPNLETASIGLEYFCQKGDGLWQMENVELCDLAARELEKLGLAKATDVIDATVIRQPKAYPVYDTEYMAALREIRLWLETLQNFQTVGRNGLHRYNNQDHSMLTALYAVDNIEGIERNLWDVNVERSYHEEFEKPERV